MKYLKRLFLCLGLFFINIIFITLIFTCLNYFNIISTKVLNIIMGLVALFSASVSSYFFGKKAKKYGWFEGLKFGMCLALLFIIINIILKSFSYVCLIYYIIIILCSVLGSIVGINKKE